MAIWLFGYLAIWLFGYLAIWLFGYLAIISSHTQSTRIKGTFWSVPRALGAWPKIDLVDEQEANQFRAVVWRSVQTSVETSVEPSVETSVETSVESPQVRLKTPEAILALLASQPTMTLAQVASQLGKSTRTVEMAVAKLTDTNRLKYVGPKKGGHWEVM